MQLGTKDEKFFLKTIDVLPNCTIIVKNYREMVFGFRKEQIIMMFMSKKVKMMIEFDLQRFAYIYNSAVNSLVIGTSEDDLIENRGSGVTIDTGEGDDSVYNRGGIDCTINTGAGNDSVKNEGNFCTINTGAGNDLVNLGVDAYRNVL